MMWLSVVACHAAGFLRVRGSTKSLWNEEASPPRPVCASAKNDFFYIRFRSSIHLCSHCDRNVTGHKVFYSFFS